MSNIIPVSTNLTAENTSNLKKSGVFDPFYFTASTVYVTERFSYLQWHDIHTKLQNNLSALNVIIGDTASPPPRTCRYDKPKSLSVLGKL